jgi:hypothetical protein
MADRMTVVIQGRDGISVEDMMRQVIDTFELVGRADPDTANSIKWAFVSAATNSPFTVIAEAKAIQRGVDVRRVAIRQKAQFRKCVQALREGSVPAAWNSQEDRKRAKAWLHRTRSIVAATVIETDDDDDAIELTAMDAVAAEPVLDLPPVQGAFKNQVGSIEGFLTSVENHHRRPAIHVRDRKTGASVLCIIPEGVRAEIAGATGLEDIWRERRVIIRGTIHFNSAGKVEKIAATSVHTVPAHHVQTADIQDPDFTGGLSAEDYVDKLRDGEIG